MPPQALRKTKRHHTWTDTDEIGRESGSVDFLW
jgi:hypothetical protein